MTQIVLVSTDKNNPRTVHVAAMYRAQGFDVVIQESGDTISGKEPSGMTLDELAFIEDTIFKTLKLKILEQRRLVKALRDDVTRFTLRDIADTVVSAYTKPPKNKPHGPQRKTRGGKIRRW